MAVIFGDSEKNVVSGTGSAQHGKKNEKVTDKTDKTTAITQNHTARRQSRRQRVQAPRQRDVQAIGQKGNQDVSLDAGLELVKDRPDREVVPCLRRGRLLRFLNASSTATSSQIMAPQLGWVFLDEIGAQ